MIRGLMASARTASVPTVPAGGVWAGGGPASTVRAGGVRARTVPASTGRAGGNAAGGGAAGGGAAGDGAADGGRAGGGPPRTIPARVIPAPTIPDEIAAGLRTDILAGRYPAGGALPPERALAAALGTNRNTLREAVRRLDEAGLVRARQGQGVRVLDWRRDGRLELLPAVLLAEGLPVGERLAVLRDALGLRTVFLADAAALASTRRDDADVAVLLDVTARVRRAAEVGPAGSGPGAQDAFRLDLEFHRGVVAAAHSQVGVFAFNTFAPAIARLLDTSPVLWALPPDYPEGLDAIARAIRDRTPEAARDAVRRHLTNTDAAVIAAMSPPAPAAPGPAGGANGEEP